MILDTATLTIVFVLLSIVLGTLLLFAWRLNSKVGALGWWGAAFGLIAIGIGIANIGRASGGYTALLIGNALALFAYGALYIGCRVFNQRRELLIHGLVGVVIWCFAYPLIYDMPRARLVLVTLIASAYAAVSAWELWKYAVQRLSSQQVAVVFLFVLAVLNLLRAPLGLAPTSIGWIDALALRWSSEMALFLVVYMPSQAFIFLSMAKERVEFDYKEAALIDPLTNIPNRRAFLQYAAETLKHLGDKPATCLLFDLDNFKAVNDSYGHEAGDHILTIFGQVLARHLPKQTFGRLGGEEFVAILPMESKEAMALAEQIGRAFTQAGQAIVGPGIPITVSVGCATAARESAQALLRKADTALYRAKDQGRNIVVSA
jgi:diguanylate cyclase (GGDEF)-like protein